MKDQEPKYKHPGEDAAKSLGRLVRVTNTPPNDAIKKLISEDQRLSEAFIEGAIEGDAIKQSRKP